MEVSLRLLKIYNSVLISKYCLRNEQDDEDQVGNNNSVHP